MLAGQGSVRLQPHGRRPVLGPVGSERHRAVVRSDQPVVGEAPFGDRIDRPGVILGHIEVAGNRVTAGGVPVSPGHEHHVAMALGPGHHVVLLAALAAEPEGEEGLVRVVRDS